MKIGKIILFLVTSIIFLSFTACNPTTTVSKGIIVPTLSVEKTTNTSLSVSRIISDPNYEYILDLTAIPDDKKSTGPKIFAAFVALFAPMTTGFQYSSVDEIDDTVTVDIPEGHRKFKVTKVGEGYKYDFNWKSNVKNSKDAVAESHIVITTDKTTEPKELQESILFGWKGHKDQGDTVNYINKYSTFKLTSGSYLGETFVIEYTSQMYYYATNSQTDGIRSVGLKGTITKNASEYRIDITSKTQEDTPGHGTKVTVKDDSEGLDNAFYTLDPKDISLESMETFAKDKIWIKYTFKDSKLTYNFPESK